ncbi:MAG: GNAT family N-acetyltransferase [Magnetococcales bacterium]|nr:GNAT family N-acetyltransferase [Magnetococcales bacterium]
MAHMDREGGCPFSIPSAILPPKGVTAIAMDTMQKEKLYNNNHEFTLDDRVIPDDRQRVRDLVIACGNFCAEDVELAVELVESYLSQGEKSGYYFLFSRSPSGSLRGYSCYGPITATDGRFDFYWIAVLPEYQGSGLATYLQVATESAMVRMGGKRSYLETSSTDGYLAARKFYTKAGYIHECSVKDFYRKGDDKCIFVKPLVQE